MKFVTIRTFSDPIQANIVNATLMNHGINSILKDEHLITMDPIITHAIGGIKLQVLEKELKDAARILSEMDSRPITNEQGDSMGCPACHSTRISSMRKQPETALGILASILSLVLLVFPFFFKRIWYCRECKHEFDPET